MFFLPWSRVQFALQNERLPTALPTKRVVLQIRKRTFGSSDARHAFRLIGTLKIVFGYWHTMDAKVKYMRLRYRAKRTFYPNGQMIPGQNNQNEKENRPQVTTTAKLCIYTNSFRKNFKNLIAFLSQVF